MVFRQGWTNTFPVQEPSPFRLGKPIRFAWQGNQKYYNDCASLIRQHLLVECGVRCKEEPVELLKAPSNEEIALGNFLMVFTDFLRAFHVLFS